MIFKHFDRLENYIGELNNVVEAIHTEELNGVNVLDLTLENYTSLKKKDRVVYQDPITNEWREFIVQEIIETHDSDGKMTIDVSCEDAVYELYSEYIMDLKPRNVSASSIAYDLLRDTRWNVIKVSDVPNLSMNFYRTSVRECLLKLCDRANLEIETSYIANNKTNNLPTKQISLLRSRGVSDGKRFVYNKDIVEITKTTHSDEIPTALYGFGKGEEIEGTDGYGKRLDFGDIIWSKSKGDPTDKPKGQMWVGDEEAKKNWGIIGKDYKLRHVFDKHEFDDIEDKEELLNETWKLLQKVKEPLVSYEMSVIDLKSVAGLEHEGVGIGDTVQVIDEEYSPAINILARVVKYTRNLLDPTQDEVIIGNMIYDFTHDSRYIEESIKSLRDKQSIWDRVNIIDENGMISGDHLTALMEQINDEINMDGGYVYISDKGDGIITYNKPIDQNPTKAIQLKGGSFRIANGKKSNGEWNWRTFGTGDGFTADLMITGTLQADLIKTFTVTSPSGNMHIDVENGVMVLRGKNTDDKMLEFTGNSTYPNLRIGNGTGGIGGKGITVTPDGRVSMGAVRNIDISDDAITSDKIAPYAVTTSKIVNNAITETKITSGAITTPKIATNAITSNKIAANAILASHIAANTINANHISAGAITTDMLYPGQGNRIVLESGYPPGSNNAMSIDANNNAIRLKYNASNYVLVNAHGVQMYKNGEQNFLTGGQWAGVSVKSGTVQELGPKDTNMTVRTGSGFWAVDGGKQVISATPEGCFATQFYPQSDVKTKENITKIDGNHTLKRNEDVEVNKLTSDEIYEEMLNVPIYTYNFKGNTKAEISTMTQNVPDKLKEFLISKKTIGSGNYTEEHINLYGYVSTLHVALKKEHERNNKLEERIKKLEELIK